MNQEAKEPMEATKVLWQPFVELRDGEVIRYEPCPSHASAISSAEKFSTELEQQQGKAVNGHGVWRVVVPVQ